MEKIRLGRTGLFVARLGWGGIPIQRIVDESEAVSVIREVIELGVDLLDTARGYTNSEGRIGLALKLVDRPVVLSTKSQKMKSDTMYGDVHESLKQLGVKKIDIYHMHAVNTMEQYEKVMSPGGAYEGLQRAKEEGLIDHIGITSHSLGVLQHALTEDRFAVIMACYGFLEPDAALKVFPLARARDVGILAMKTFSGGVVEEAGPAIRFVLAEEGVVPIPGSETLERARENWRVFTEGGSLTAVDKARIEAVRKDMDRQFCRRCDYCKPCTAHISIQHMVGLRSAIKRFGPQVRGLDWMKKMTDQARECTECGECLPRCPYQLPITDLIKENLALYDEVMAGKEAW